MSAVPERGVTSLSLSLAQEVDAVCLRFEAAWQAGQRPRIEDYLRDTAGHGQAALLWELLRVELERRAAAGEQLRPDEYQSRFPGHAALVCEAFARLGPAAGDHRAWPAVPGYDVLGELGRGAMGVVYKARQTSLAGRLVALKMVLAGDQAGAPDLARFRAEAEAVARLQHPNVVQIYEVGEQDGLPWFSLEYVGGGSLAGRLDGTPLPPAEAAQLVEVLARAVHCAHESGIVHRDLKPANVLLAACGPVGGAQPHAADWVPKITDFGLAKRLDGAAGQTATGAIVGTPSYMAPEQAQGKGKEVGRAADIYALGAILYELLTGRPPFRAATMLDTILQVISEDPVPPRRLQSKTPRDLETVCLKCLRKEPHQRYASALALADDLRAFREGRGIRARRAPWWEKVARWGRRRPAAAALVLLGAALPPLMAGGAFWYWGHEATIRIQERQREAASLVDALATCETPAVPGIIARLEDYRRWADPLLKQKASEADERGKAKLHFALALLRVDPAQKEYLAGRLLTAGPDELPVVRDLLGGDPQVAEGLWKVLESPNAEPNQRLRAACALASYTPSDRRWLGVREAVAAQLVAEQPLAVGAWAKALRPAGDALIPALAAAFREAGRSASERILAVNLLAEYAADQPETLADLILDADDKQFAVLFPRLQGNREGAAAVCAQVLAMPLAEQQTEAGPAHLIVQGLGAQGVVPGMPALGPMMQTLVAAKVAQSDAYALQTEEKKERLAGRQANAGVALLRLGQPGKVWPLLRHGPDPRVRTYLIHRLGPLGADPTTILQRLEEEQEVSTRRALLLSLGEFRPEKFVPPVQESSVVMRLYQEDQDPGVHGAAEWLLRQWGRQKALQEMEERWAKDEQQHRRERLKEIGQEMAKDGASPRWYVNGQGQTLAAIRPADFPMGSPEEEPERFPDAEELRRMDIGRPYAIATKEVTVAQFRHFLNARPEMRLAFETSSPRKYSPDDEGPVLAVKWYEAAEYCNWLSEQEGIPANQWCYPRGVGGAGAGLMMPPNYLHRTGYRLPTEAEWEYACRAGAVTSRSYGASADMLGKYAWYAANSKDRAWPVGRLKPNDFGLFDMYGNAWEWCQNQADHKGRANVDEEEEPIPLDNVQTWVLRGGSFKYYTSWARSAASTYSRARYRDDLVGLRVARTLLP
jgi:formylglycine-generating enzyme required for sulfatase activity